MIVWTIARLDSAGIVDSSILGEQISNSHFPVESAASFPFMICIWGYILFRGNVVLVFLMVIAMAMAMAIAMEFVIMIILPQVLRQVVWICHHQHQSFY